MLELFELAFGITKVIPTSLFFLFESDLEKVELLSAFMLLVVVVLAFAGFCNALIDETAEIVIKKKMLAKTIFFLKGYV